MESKNQNGEVKKTAESPVHIFFIQTQGFQKFTVGKSNNIVYAMQSKVCISRLPQKKTLHFSQL